MGLGQQKRVVAKPLGFAWDTEGLTVTNNGQTKAEAKRPQASEVERQRTEMRITSGEGVLQASTDFFKRVLADGAWHVTTMHRSLQDDRHRTGSSSRNQKRTHRALDTVCK